MELAAKPEAAERYFVIDQDFDFSTFDLYAEIGASPAIFSRVYDELDAAASELRARNNKEPILLGEGISPANIRKRDATERLKKRLQSAVEAVKNGSSNLQEKQDLLDLQDRVREEAGKQRNIHDEEADQKWAERIAPIDRVGLIWTVATVLLGAGAEHLEAPEKRKLSALLISSSAVFIDEWSRIQAEFDFEGLKKAITTDEALADMPGPADLEEKRKFVTGLIDIFEYTAMADPLRRTMMFLCEQARQRVLAPSVEAAEVGGLMESLIKGTWLLDVDPARGRRPLRDAMKALASTRASTTPWLPACDPSGRIGWAASPSKVTRSKDQRGSGSRSSLGYSYISSVSLMRSANGIQSKFQFLKCSKNRSLGAVRSQVPGASLADCLPSTVTQLMSDLPASADFWLIG